MGDHIFRVFVNMMLRKIFESKFKEKQRGWRTCYNEGFVGLVSTKYYTGDAAK
jgi:hypothetical protein